ncbi:carboxymuconolactone decarboxylase family protein [Paeniglutamicibacter cryotolerans]|uniref:carboxymuconolactone decarboxylase family protein n=1 Tax=Paeniglutamicibacter cryotolerans TaxID=670079 RepID=UPI0028B24903|nr:carboxymuconolactone decarboxylase family protein [Paeniglutamicibacter cryotolerans]
MNLSKQTPDAYQGLLAMSKAAGDAAAEAGLDARLCELVKIRASQINGCAFCLRLHVRDALRHGETGDRLAVLPAWRETGYFTDQECAALELAEAITLVSDGPLSDEVYGRVSAVLDAAQLSAVGWMTASINAFNRIAVASRYDVKG